MTDSTSNMAPGPLAGIRVLEIASMIFGPVAGQYLGDLGADVIKLENPRTGAAFCESPATLMTKWRRFANCAACLDARARRTGRDRGGWRGLVAEAAQLLRELTQVRLIVHLVPRAIKCVRTGGKANALRFGLGVV